VNPPNIPWPTEWANKTSAPISWEKTPDKPITTSEVLKLIRQPPEPRQLPTEAREFIPFPEDALSPTLQNAVLATIDIYQCPAVMAAASFLGAAAVAVQAHVNVVLPYDKGASVPISLNFITIADSGERKTTVDREALAPIEFRASELAALNAREFAQYKLNFKVWESETKRVMLNQKLSPQEKVSALAVLGPEPVKPLLPQLICDDFTTEGVYTLLRDGQPSIGVISSEGGIFVGGHAMSKEAELRTISTLNKAWDGQKLERNRVVSEESYALVGRRISTHLQIQSDIADDLFSRKQVHSAGWFNRALIAKPESTMGTRLSEPTSKDNELHLAMYKSRILEILRSPCS
jgi:hypothetical protein